MSLRQTTSYNQYRGHQITVAPAVDPISVDELVEYLKLGETDEGQTLLMFIKSAIGICERYLNISFITQTWKMTLDRWSNNGEPWWDGIRDAHINVIANESRSSDILLPRFPLQSIASITADGNAVTVADVFIVDTQQIKGRLVLKRGAVLPEVSDEAANGIVITYVSGYGATAALVPADLRLALLQFSAYMYENRGDGCTAEAAFKKSGAKAIMDGYKVMDL